MGKIIISTHTQDDMQLKIDVIHTGIRKGNKKHKTDFIVENVDDEDLFYVCYQIACEIFITKEIKD